VKIEALLFDLGKVLVNFNFETGAKALHASCPIARDRFNEVLWDQTWVRRYEQGDISTAQFYNYLREAAGLQMTLREFCETWSSIFLPDPLVSDQLLTALKRRYPLILVSNTNEAHAEFIRERYRLFDFFDHLVLSYQVGSLKPDTRSLNTLSRSLGVLQARCFLLMIVKRTSLQQERWVFTRTSLYPRQNSSKPCCKPASNYERRHAFENLHRLRSRWGRRAPVGKHSCRHANLPNICIQIYRPRAGG
jgi:putative hydrolase of the HAD superfamily